MELFYTNATTPPARAEFTTSCKTHFQTKLGATILDSSVNNKLNDQWGNECFPNLPVFLSSMPFQGKDGPVTRILLADECSCS